MFSQHRSLLHSGERSACLLENRDPPWQKQNDNRFLQLSAVCFQKLKPFLIYSKDGGRVTSLIGWGMFIWWSSNKSQALFQLAVLYDV